MSRKWLPWFIALVPVLAALIVLQTVPPRDFRASGAMSIFALTPLVLLILIAQRRPWAAQSLARKSGGVLAMGAMALVFLFTGVFGTPEFLRHHFGLFISVDDYGPRAIAASSDGYVVVGDNADNEGIVWYSSDGHQWTRAEHGDRFERLDVGDVTWDKSLFVLVAHDDRRGPIVSLISPDGLTWNRAAASEIDGKPRSVASNAGTLAVVGSSFSNDGVYVYGDAAGPLNTAEPRPRIDRNRDPFFVASYGSGFLAAGNQGSDAFFMHSEDGSSWSELNRIPEVEITSVTPHQAGFAAVGRDRDTDQPRLWLSSDGELWSSAQPPTDNASTRLDLICSYEASLFIFGHDVSSNSTVWWELNDLDAWREHPSPFGDALLRDVLITRDLSLVVGVDRDLDSAAIWVAEDNVNWNRIEHSEIFSVR